MKLKSKKTIVSFLLCCFIVLSSCSQSTVITQTETAEADAFETKAELNQSNETKTYDQILSKRIDKDFEGKNFRIATDNVDLILADNGESLLGKEHYLRNAAIEKKYNIKITLTDESGTTGIIDRIRTEALSGNDYCDLILVESLRFQGLTNSKALLNVRSIPYLDINADFYFDKSLAATTLGDMSYGIAGDFVYKPEDVFVVFFNKTLLSQAPLPDVYSLVNSNQWDMENFLLYSEELYSLAKENSTNIYGIISTETQEDLVKIFWAATGMDFLKNQYGKRPELIYNTDQSRDFIDQYRDTFIRSVSYSSLVTQQSAVSSFGNGESLFLIAPIKTASQIVGRGIDWGIAPIPKLDINQKNYYSCMQQNYTLAGFAKGTKDLDLCGVITSALFATSKGLNQKYAVQTYLNLYFSSENDAETMKEIIETPYYDAVDFFGEIDQSFPAASYTLLYRSAANEADFQTLYDKYTKMLNNYLDTIF